MRILFAAPEEAWGGIYYAIRSALPEYAFEATGCHEIQSLKGFDVLIPAMSSVTDALMSSSDRLRLIQQCGAALEGVDLDAARKRDVWVASVPTTVSGSADSAADLGIHFMIALAKDFKGMQLSFQDRKLGYPIGRALAGRTAGIVGLGGIGRALVKRLRAFGVRLIGTKRRNQQQAMEELGLEWVGRPRDLRLLLRQSDFVFLCLPLTHESRELMNHDTFPAMKVDSYLINLARGGLVVRDALEEALAAGRIAGAGMDVFWRNRPTPMIPYSRTTYWRRLTLPALRMHPSVTLSRWLRRTYAGPSAVRIPFTGPAEHNGSGKARPSFAVHCFETLWDYRFRNSDG